MVDIRITDHARVRESDAAGAAVARGPREGGATDRAAGRHQRFGAEEEDEESASTERAGEEEEVVYEPDGAIDVRVHVDEVKQYFTELKDRHKCPVKQPQEWFEIV